MYETLPTLRPPARSLQPLWRYLSAKRLLDLLKTKELYFSHLPALEDSLEGALTLRTREHMANWFQQHNRLTRTQAYAAVDKYQQKRQSFYVNCWHMNDHESYLMWKAYAGCGFAIQTTYERLQASLSNSPHIVTGGVVKYVDFERDLTTVGNVFNHVATKDMPYRDEREFRLVFWDIDPRNVDHPKLPKGLCIPVDVKMLISGLVRSPYPEQMDPELEKLIEQHEIALGSSAVATRGSK